MQELQQFAAVCKERFGIEAFQIHIHKDEGYMIRTSILYFYPTKPAFDFITVNLSAWILRGGEACIYAAYRTQKQNK